LAPSYVLRRLCAVFERLGVPSFIFTPLWTNDSGSAMPFHSSDDVTAVDDPTASTGGQIPTEIEASRLKKRNSLPNLKYINWNGKVLYPFLESPDDRDITLFTTLAVAKPFATAKGKGILEAWQAAVDDLNSQINKGTCCNLFDPPIAVKTVRDRFDNVMKLIGEISAGTIPQQL
jgi:hypothetical protein